jgi:hypothetical protein
MDHSKPQIAALECAAQDSVQAWESSAMITTHPVRTSSSAPPPNGGVMSPKIAFRDILVPATKVLQSAKREERQTSTKDHNSRPGGVVVLGALRTTSRDAHSRDMSISSLSSLSSASGIAEGCPQTPTHASVLPHPLSYRPLPTAHCSLFLPVPPSCLGVLVVRQPSPKPRLPQSGSLTMMVASFP